MMVAVAVTKLSCQWIALSDMITVEARNVLIREISVTRIEIVERVMVEA